ncbi:MAG: NADH:ubiquinone reductase (Na(+)-transporting) subunit C [Fluviicola sp. XM-24bin1]|nr:MAG: NADH:ubiquinone reductase (Na(+)-transporting) subunit C [Fluviicola sp. XM-24bin1]
MAINKDSNGYTFGFAIALVVVVGAILAGVAMATKPFQEKNEAVKKKMDILKAILPKNEAEKVTRKNATAMFDEMVKLEDAVVLDINGKVKEDITGDAILDIDIKKEYRDKTLKDKDKSFPLFISTDADGKKSYVIPVVGKGLWGPVWGNICLDDDMRTIKGATFDHKTETPGLGAEIKQAFFIDRWIGEQITDDSGNPITFEIVKDNSGSEPVKVDGITGGTITSKGVEEMVNRGLKPYIEYFKTLK